MKRDQSQKNKKFTRSGTEIISSPIEIEDEDVWTGIAGNVKDILRILRQIRGIFEEELQVLQEQAETTHKSSRLDDFTGSEEEDISE